MLLVAGSLIVERLRKTFPEIGVFSTADLAGVSEQLQTVPALHVILHSYVPDNEDGAGDVRWREIWLIVVVVKNVSRSDRVLAQIDDAEAIVNRLVESLSGFVFPRRSGVTGSLKVIPGPKPLFTDAHAYFPLAVEASPKTSGCGGYAEYS